MALLATHGHSHEAQQRYTLTQFRAYLEAARDLEANRAADTALALRTLLMPSR